MNKIEKCFRLSKAHKSYINSIKTAGVLVGNEWDRYKNENELKSIKAYIRNKLHKNQKGRCAYCGNKYYVTSEAHIEHIAAKGAKRYPMFMFTEHNLVLSCQYCNGFSKKGNKNTIDVLKQVYKICNFNIVHPYFDDPNIHYDWVTKNDEVIIKYKTAKGRRTIKMFKLDQPTQSEARAKDALYKEYKMKPVHEKLINLALVYRTK